jgi:fructose-1,6-bisphosphatase I
VLAAKIARAGIEGDLFGSSGASNASGDAQKKLDVVANDVFKAALAGTRLVGVMASEEDEAAVVVAGAAASGRYAAVFDPLDGSRNIECNVATGTILGLYALLPVRTGVYARALRPRASKDASTNRRRRRRRPAPSLA